MASRSTISSSEQSFLPFRFNILNQRQLLYWAKSAYKGSVKSKTLWMDLSRMDVCFCIQPGPFQQPAKRSISGHPMGDRCFPGWEIVLHARNYLSPFSQGPCEPAGVKTEAGVSKGRKKGDKKRYMYENNLGPGINEKAKVHPSYSLHPPFLPKAIDLFTERDFLAFLSQLKAGVDEDQSWKMFLSLKLKVP